jgi:hypothetical protein
LSAFVDFNEGTRGGATVPKYRKRPIVVEAEPWFPSVAVKGVRHFPAMNGMSECWFVVTIHGQHAYLSPGDWVITESDGEHHYPCKPDEFDRIYEPVAPNPDA